MVGNLPGGAAAAAAAPFSRPACAASASPFCTTASAAGAPLFATAVGPGAGAGAAAAAAAGAAASRASGLGSAESFAASFSSCALYSCAARDVYCAHTADPSGAHPYCKDLHRVLHATEHGVFQVVGMGLEEIRLD